ncbi:glycoside hydrolase family 31 [Paludibacter propionicigenes WB4]|uniref:Glycoside hydrolase family 31 n=1 Tax=Paludibacter propionicigenes (strain DSM 17365 / JCM 13257 / WB4) TaxID=694427 RepID=E4T4X0_PALPW|nr:TIM-barrel domain-containing protein [Paludibacter propionicigenes]ADQ79764.1 glycoside hydrolase family 31 [Paludibacter propionicigenes WB4]
MKLKFLLLAGLFPLLCQGQIVKSFKQLSDRVNVTLADGTLSISPLSDNAVRIKFYKVSEGNLPELVFTAGTVNPVFQVVDSPSKLEIKVPKITVLLDKQTGTLSYADKTGKVFLSEKAGTRKLTPDVIQGESCFAVEQSFESPADESVFGLGQFQDGQYNLKNVARRLTQVNTQIAIPFIYSSKGYGLLWHQYGLTDFNPADNSIALNKQEQSTNGNAQMAEVTTTSGTQKVSQNQSLYQGKFNVPADGEYSIFLDLGDMGNRHFVVIDGKPCMDQSNMWLPPTAGALVNLKAGEHQVQVLCKSNNTPKLSWRQSDNSATFRSPVAKALDYIVFYGPSADDVIASYRNLSGNAPMFPKWAYGFWQCRERYTSGTHLVETIKEFRKRNLPVDVIVQDWQYWGNRGWGVPQFDEKNYPNPAGFIKELHDLNAHFNISIWSNPDKNSAIGKEYVAKNRFIPNTKWLDYFNPETRKEYWNTLKVNMFDNGVDSWWMDAVEPENDALKGEKTFIGAGDFYRLTYPLMVSQAVYEGQREASSDKRVCILTRSAFSGQQRYGVINWSGDIGYTWDVFRNQIVAGLNYTITGMPYWTTDIGGFFRPGRTQYTDEKYHELLTRWYQWGAMSPIFRMHGYQTETEPWKFGQKVEDNMRKMLNLRYRLLPYIYSEAWQVTKNGSTMMRPLVMDFNGDADAVSRQFQYMFGKSILTAPVTEANATEWNVYLPKSAGWFDFWTGKQFKGGQTVKTAAPLDRIPLFVKAGSIIPMGKIIQSTAEKSDTLEIRIYKGANGGFTLYEDEGDNYNYEKGKYSTISFHWNEKTQSLTIGDKKGNYSGSLKKRIFNVVLVDENKGFGINTNAAGKKVSYLGKQIKLSF